MQNQKLNTGGASGDKHPVKDDVASAFKNEASSARETLQDARDNVQRKAGEYASEAKAAAFQQAEGAQQGMGESIAALGGAMRAAGEHLAKGEQNTMSKLMNDAAGGIERFSDSLKNKKFEEILDDVRTLGRDNSGALFAGSILAGLALGRFVKSSVPDSDNSNDAGAHAGRDGSTGQRRSGEGYEARPATPSRSFGDSGEPTTPSADRAWPSQQDDSLSSKANLFGEGSGEKQP